ncbi:MAG: tetratricopeptide repeat protein [Treponema sp.]|jgi:tetratricopeptide (TPR) repeat protein|nr:tetratricopeptide repeat protein [Treponema sp.]
MKLKQGSLKSVLILIVIALAFTGFFAYKKISTRNSLAARIAALSPRGAPPQSIEDLRKAIALYEEKIEAHVADAAQTGVYWKILGSRLIDKKLYGEALEALEMAALYYPEDETVQYLIGVSAGTLAQSEYFDPPSRESHLRLAEQAYLRALAIDERYGKALYGLSVLYVYMEPRRPEQAVPYLRLYLDIHKSDTDAMFVLANAYYQTGEYQGASDLYDRIIDLSKNGQTKETAGQLKQQVLDVWYGS